MAERPNPSSDFEILAQPASPSIRALLDYWTAERGDRPVLPRSAIDPERLKEHLPVLVLLDVLDGGREFRYRLIGTRIVTMSGRDATGERFGELYAAFPAELAMARALLGRIVSDRRPAFIGGRMFWLPERNYRRFEVGCFPVSSDGAAVDIILCEVAFF